MALRVLFSGDSRMCHNRNREENSYRLPRRWRRTSQCRGRPPNGNLPTAARLAGGAHPVPGSDGLPGYSAEIDRDPNSTAVQHSVTKRVDAGEQVFTAGFAGNYPLVSQAFSALAREILAGEAGGPAHFGHSAF